MRHGLRGILRALTEGVSRGASRLGTIALRAARGVAPVVFHIGVVVLSAGIALSLPFLISQLARNLLVYWALVENEKIFLTALEILVATLLILFLNALRSWTRDRRLARIARAAGMVHFTSNRRFLARRRLRRLREKQGIGKDVMVIGSTGFRTFVYPEGDLYNVIRHARGARIMLLNPNSDGASTRAKTILDPEVTPERLRAQIRESIAFLKELRAAQRDVKLKLYSDPPFLKLAILGDYVWLQHYHAGLDVQGMPEYLFRYDQTPQSLYVIFYEYFEYFLRRWNDPDIPEYDLDRDELVFRDGAGNEVKRMPGEDLAQANL